MIRDASSHSETALSGIRRERFQPSEPPHNFRRLGRSASGTFDQRQAHSISVTRRWPKSDRPRNRNKPCSPLPDLARQFQRSAGKTQRSHEGGTRQKQDPQLANLTAGSLGLSSKLKTPLGWPIQIASQKTQSMILGINRCHREKRLRRVRIR